MNHTQRWMLSANGIQLIPYCSALIVKEGHSKENGPVMLAMFYSWSYCILQLGCFPNRKKKILMRKHPPLLRILNAFIEVGGKELSCKQSFSSSLYTVKKNPYKELPEPASKFCKQVKTKLSNWFRKIMMKFETATSSLVWKRTL